MMTRFEFFEKGLGLVACKLGAIPLSLLIKYDIYKTYLEQIEQGNVKSEARKLTVEKTNTHYSTVHRAIEWFEK